MRKLLAVFALLFATKVQAQLPTACAGQPTAAYNRLTDTTYRSEQNVALAKSNHVCVGTATAVLVAGAVKYEVRWSPCVVGQSWRVGSQYTSMTTAMTQAFNLPTCAAQPDTILSAATTTVALLKDSVLVGTGDSVLAKVITRTTTGKATGSGRTVTITASGTTVGTVTYNSSDSSYRAYIKGVTVGAVSVVASAGAVTFNQIPTLRIVNPSTPPPANTTPFVWTNVTPSAINLATDPGCGNYGIETVNVDPNRQSDFYAFAHCQGLWKSTDYGLTWTGPINTGTNGATAGNCAGGIRVASNGTATPTIHLSCIRGAVGYWRSTDGGVNWTNINVAPLPSNRQDVYPPYVDPYDPTHLIMAGHEQDYLVESTNSGTTWTSIPIPVSTGGGTSSINFINTGSATTTRSSFLWMPQQVGSIGTYRTTDRGVTWSKVDGNEHPHGYAETWQDTSGLYMAGAYSALGWGVLRSKDLGITWTHLGVNGNYRVFYRTQGFLYSSTSYPSGLNTSYGPGFQLSPQPGNGTWSQPATPSGMQQGAAQVAVGGYQNKSYIVTANYGAGLWRWIDTTATITAPVVVVVPPTADTVISASVSTVVLSSDSMRVGTTLTAKITLKNAAGNKLTGKTATAVLSTGAYATISSVTYSASDTSYNATVTGTAIGSMNLNVAVSGSSATATRAIRVVATPTGTSIPANTWYNVTPSNANITTDLPCGNYGVNSLGVDPTTSPATMYSFFDCQGVWKSVDYGATWTGPINTGTNGTTVADCAGGLTVGQDGTLHLACIRGTGTGYWNSHDHGVSWQKYTITPGGARQDIYAAVIDPYDPLHLIVSGHEFDMLAESTDGGITWSSIPLNSGMLVGNGTNVINFINTGTPSTTRNTYLWIAQQSGGIYGTWRTTDHGTTWVKVDNNEHLHGNSPIYQPNTTGVVYMAGVYSNLGWGVLRSTDYGATWSHVNGVNGTARVVIGTGSRLLHSVGYPGGLGSSFGPGLATAAQPGTGAWTDIAAPSGMLQGSNAMAATTDGTYGYVVSANITSGLWRYSEAPASGSVAPLTNGTPITVVFTAPFVAQADTVASSTNTTFTRPTDSVQVGSTISVKAIIRNAAGQAISGKTVTIALTSTSFATIGSVTGNATDTSYNAIITGTNAGTSTVNMTLAGSSVTKSLTMRTVPTAQIVPQSSLTWTQCGTVPSICNSNGPHYARLVSPTDTSISFMMNSIACAVNYNGQFTKASTTASYTRCDVSNQLYDTIPNSNRADPAQPLVWYAPKGDPGSRIVDTAFYNHGAYTLENTAVDTASWGGDFRTQCNVAKYGIFDPVIYPGQAVAGHLHVFMGNININPNSATDSTVNNPSTCYGGYTNQTGYWSPALYDTLTKEVITPIEGVFYYKRSYNDGKVNIVPMPYGLSMIAGDKNATGNQLVNSTAEWYCPSTGSGGEKPDGSIGTCPYTGVDGYIQLSIKFPDCWNGTQLTSANGKSHMAYMNYNSTTAGSTCPATHPVHIPQVSELFRYPIRSTDVLSRWRLASDAPTQTNGQSKHADWQLGWKSWAMSSFVSFCLNGHRDCGVNDIGNYLNLFYHPLWQ